MESDGSTAGKRASVSRRLGGVLILALVVRWIAFWWSEATTLGHWDEFEYYANAAALAGGRHVLDEGRRQPGVVWYFSAFLIPFGSSPQVARLSNVIPSCVAVWLVFLLGKRLGGPRVGLLAATFAALDPTLVFYAVGGLSEPLYIALSLGVLALIPYRPPPGIGRSILAGLVAGLAALAREVGVVLSAAGALWLLHLGARKPFGVRKRAGVAALLFAGGFLASVAPWSVHLNRGDLPFAFLTRTTYFNLYLGNVEFPRRGHATEITRGMRAYRALGKTAPEREAAARGPALRAIADRMPWWPFEKLAEVLPPLAAPASLPVHRLLARPARTGPGPSAYVLRTDGTGAEGLRDVVAWIAVGSWVVVFVAGAAGLALAWREPMVPLLVLVAALHVVASVATFAIPRFRLPFVPVLMLGAAWLFVHGRRRWRETTAPARLCAVGVAVAAAVLVVLGALGGTEAGVG